MVLLRPLIAKVLFIGDWLKRCRVGCWPTAEQRPFLFRSIAVVFAAMLGLAGVAEPEAALAAPAEPAPAYLAVAGGSMFHFAGDRPTDIGVANSHLQVCPESPNCVSSQSRDDEHYVEPIQFTGNSRRAMQALKHAIDDSERAEVLKSEGNYIYAEFTSKLMGFVDDVEFYVNEGDKTIEVRSASRLGESDLGINRQRVETLRQQFWTLLDSEPAEL